MPDFSKLSITGLLKIASICNMVQNFQRACQEEKEKEEGQ